MKDAIDMSMLGRNFVKAGFRPCHKGRGKARPLVRKPLESVIRRFFAFLA